MSGQANAPATAPASMQVRCFSPRHSPRLTAVLPQPLALPSPPRLAVAASPCRRRLAPRRHRLTPHRCHLIPVSPHTVTASPSLPLSPSRRRRRRYCPRIAATTPAIRTSSTHSPVTPSPPIPSFAWVACLPACLSCHSRGQCRQASGSNGWVNG